MKNKKLKLNEKRVTSVSDVGSLIKDLRKDMNITQREAAGLCGVGVRFISDLENHKPTLQIEKVLHVLNCFGLDITLTKKGLDNA